MTDTIPWTARDSLISALVGYLVFEFLRKKL